MYRRGSNIDVEMQTFRKPDETLGEWVVRVRDIPYKRSWINNLINKVKKWI